MSFSIGADDYDRFMGRYSVPLATQFAEFAGVAAGQRVLDVGCGPGALTTELVRQLGADAVWAVDPSERFVAAVRARHAGVRVQRAAAEKLPFEDELFDTALAQLVVHFMADPVAGLREMARVTRAHGLVAACVWDHADGLGPLSRFWDAARQLDHDVEDESRHAGARRGDLAEMFQAAGYVTRARLRAGGSTARLLQGDAADNAIRRLGAGGPGADFVRTGLSSSGHLSRSWRGG